MSELVAVEGGLEDVNDYVLARVWKDGLPIYLPTRQAVERMLGGIDRFRTDHGRAAVPCADDSEEISLVVAGGPGPHSRVLPAFGVTTRPVTRPVRGCRQGGTT